MRKSRQAAQLEQRFGKPIKEIVKEAYDREGSLEAAAHSLGVKPNTFAGWFYRLGLQVKKTASVA